MYTICIIIDLFAIWQFSFVPRARDNTVSSFSECTNKLADISVFLAYKTRFAYTFLTTSSLILQSAVSSIQSMMSITSDQ